MPCKSPGAQEDVTVQIDICTAHVWFDSENFTFKLDVSQICDLGTFQNTADPYKQNTRQYLKQSEQNELYQICDFFVNIWQTKN